MTYLELITEAREIFSTELNPFLEGLGLEDVNVFLNSSFKLSKTPLSLAVYPTTSNGTTAEEQERYTEAYFVVELFVNDTANESSVEKATAYFDAILSFLEHRIFGGQSSVVDTAVLFRMDDDSPFNGSAFLVRSQILHKMDYTYF